MPAKIGFFEKYGIIDIILVDGVEFWEKAIASRVKKISMRFLMINKVWLINDLSSINWIKIKNTFV